MGSTLVFVSRTASKATLALKLALWTFRVLASLILAILMFIAFPSLNSCLIFGVHYTFLL